MKQLIEDNVFNKNLCNENVIFYSVFEKLYNSNDNVVNYQCFDFVTEMQNIVLFSDLYFDCYEMMSFFKLVISCYKDARFNKKLNLGLKEVDISISEDELDEFDLSNEERLKLKAKREQELFTKVEY